MSATAFCVANSSAAPTNIAFAKKASLSFLGASKNKQMSSLSSITSLKSTAVVEEIDQAAVVEHPSFEIIDKDVVAEYGCHCVMYKHKKTGAELLSVKNDDDNKVFGITFRTPPTDSTGVPHILEHSVLCGSRKYRTKEPFVQLLQGSLQTFLNAMTYPDRTCYVLASQNDKDFKNLVNVYADAVFHPRATSDPMVHAQEGWHLELEDKEDPLTYKGVVYNEMVREVYMLAYIANINYFIFENELTHATRPFRDNVPIYRKEFTLHPTLAFTVSLRDPSFLLILTL